MVFSSVNFSSACSLSRPLPLCVAAERNGHITIVIVVDEDRAGLQAAAHVVGAGEIAVHTAAPKP